MDNRLLNAPSHLPRPLRLTIVACAVGVLLWLSLAPTKDLPGSNLMWDKAEHAIAYFVLMVLGFVFAPRRLAAFTVFAISLGVVVEVLQATMGFGREGDWRDAAADLAGVCAGFVIWRLAAPRRAG